MKLYTFTTTKGTYVIQATRYTEAYSILETLDAGHMKYVEFN